MERKDKKRIKGVVITAAIIIHFTLLTGGCLDTGRDYKKGKINVEFKEIEWLLGLNRSEYDDHFEKGLINDTLREAFKDKGYPLGENATLSKPEDKLKWADWLIYEDGEIKYEVVYLITGDRKIAIYRMMTLERANEIVDEFNCSVDEWVSRGSSNDWEAIVNVPKGKEKKYVRLFENHTAVESAHLESVLI